MGVAVGEGLTEWSFSRQHYANETTRLIRYLLSSGFLFLTTNADNEWVLMGTV
ncbi:hypothetical protein PGR6_02390 [Pseudomonas sp. GR 6-02]|nr:hypothetical protein PGR6_02390 [Pseudomonas sp. GR 6-02]